MPGVSGFCAQGRCAQCDSPGCGCREAPHLRFHELDDPAPAKLVLVQPPCSFCWDKAAAVEVTTIWSWQASLCMDCAERIGSDRSGWRELRAGPGEPPLPTEAEAGAYVESQTWKRCRPTFRGRPQPKHEYVLLRRSTSPALQLRVLYFIREHGERRRFGGSYHHYWTWGDYEYWELSPQDTILNRRHLSWPTTA
jgi:hypothetical protein